jgi:predicted metal-dependent peptidase
MYFSKCLSQGSESRLPFLNYFETNFFKDKTMTTLKKLLKARTALVLDEPFFGCLALRMQLVEDASFETAAVDGINMYYNPKFIESLTSKELIGVLAHEVLHLALGHLWRQDNRDHDNWNKAADYTINGTLTESGFTLPDGCLLDHKYDDMSAEEIYTSLQNQPKQDGDKNGDGNGSGKPDQSGQSGQKKSDPGKCGGMIKPKTEADKKEIESTWKAATAAAASMSKGKLPGNIKRQIDELLNPSVPWHILLRDFVEKSAKNDYDWTRPNKRYINSGFILPSLVSEELPEIIIAVDTSGSIDMKALNHFSAEASNVLSAYDTTVTVIYCDTEVQHEEVFTRADMPMKMNPKGGGGTKFTPVFDHVNEKGYTPACLIYFTDMYGDFPKHEPEYPVMWLTDSKEQTAPFGKVVLFDME